MELARLQLGKRSLDRGETPQKICGAVILCELHLRVANIVGPASNNYDRGR